MILSYRKRCFQIINGVLEVAKIFDLIIEHGQVFLQGTLVSCALGIQNGQIEAILNDAGSMQAKTRIDAKGKIVLPGGIDTHVHFRDPGNSERETFETGSAAAASGGVTLVLEHPVSNPPQYNKEILDIRKKVAQPQAHIDYMFYGAAGGEFTNEIVPLSKEGIAGYKSFLHVPPKGREKEFTGLTMSDDGQIYDVFHEIAKTGMISAVHCENDEIIRRLIARFTSEGRTDLKAHIESRPLISEVECIEKMIRMARETGVTLLCAHVSSAEGMELIKQAKAKGQKIYAETCPHYLILDESDFYRVGPYARCNPPLRPREEADKLWKYVNDGTVDFMASDHSPFLPTEKEVGFTNIFMAGSGLIGIDLRVPLTLDCVNKGQLSLAKAVDLLSTNAAKAFNVFPRKGAIQIGADADLMIVDMNQETVVDHRNCYSKSAASSRVYEGRKLSCKITHTICRGRIVMEDGKVSPSTTGWGKLVVPNRAE